MARQLYDAKELTVEEIARTLGVSREDHLPAPCGGGIVVAVVDAHHREGVSQSQAGITYGLLRCVSQRGLNPYLAVRMDAW